jgi:hypothetical protein
MTIKTAIKTTLKATLCRYIGFEVRTTFQAHGNDTPRIVSHFTWTRPEALDWMTQYPSYLTGKVELYRHSALIGCRYFTA